MWPIYWTILWATCSVITAAAASSSSSSESSIYSHPKWVPNNNVNSRHIPNRYIVELEDDYNGSISQFLDDDWILNYEYNASTIFRGFSLHLKEQAAGKQVHATATVSKLQRMMDQPAVKHVFPVVEIPRPVVTYQSTLRAQDVDISPEIIGKLPFTHALSQVDRVHRELGLTGKGLTIGIVDTGVDYTHPALGGGFGPGYKIQLGADLVGNNFQFLDPSSAKPRDTPLDDCNSLDGGHGTHVAGIIGANDEKYGLIGVAPNATLGMWRIFGCEGSTTNDLVIKALTMAFDAGCDVINLSLGSPNCWPEDPASVVANRIAAQNVSVIVAAGNEGENGAYMISTPATGSRVISVASIDNDYSLERTLTTDTGLEFPYDLSSTTPEFPNGTLIPYSNAPTNADACEGTVPDNDIKGAIALVKRGSCQFDIKAKVAAEHGAIAVLVYDSSGQDPFEPSTTTAPIPLAAISYVAGQQLAQQSGVHVNFNLQLSPTKISTGGQVSPFSSVGPTYENGLKPDLAAIGGFVFSTLPLYRGGYGTLSGTSMASPYVAGVCALFMEAHRSQRDSLYILERFQNYASLVRTGQGVYENTIKQGAGLIQAYDAITAPVHISPARLSFNDTANRAPQSLTITNYADHQISFTLRNLPGIGVEPFNTSSPAGQQLAAPVLYSNATANLDFDTGHRNRLHLRPGESRSIRVSVSNINVPEGAGSFFPIFSGHIQFEIEQLAAGEQTKSNLHVPYMGVVGNVNTLRIFDDDFPQLGDSRGFQYENNNSPYVIDRSDYHRNAVMIFTRLLLGTAHLRGLVFDENQQKVVGTAFSIDYVQRNTMQEQAYKNGDLWNGTMVPLGLPPQDSTYLVPVPDGIYRLRIEALRLLADPNDPKNWESKDTPPIIVTGG